MSGGCRDDQPADDGIVQKDEIALIHPPGCRLARMTEREIALLPDCGRCNPAVTVGTLAASL
jgi:hypothetical protein